MPIYEVTGWLEIPKVEADSLAEARKAAMARVVQDPEQYLCLDIEEAEVCRFCGGGCDWATLQRDVCTALACLAKLKAEATHA